jgi:predicted phosphodiesterase
LCVGCFKPAEERAQRDEEVGQASGSGLEVTVADGLAAVRSLDEAKLHLWENAPALDIRLESEQAPRTLELFVENCMPGAVLTAVSGDVSITEATRTRPTECSFSLGLTSKVTELRLADPVTEQSGTFHFGVLSDIQEAIDDVQDVFSRINRQPNLSFVIAAGDLTERGTVEELERFQSEQKTLNVPYYVTLGNHELGESPPPYHDFYGRGSSSFVFRGVRFTFLDSASATLDSRVYDWLDTWLAQGKSGVHVVTMHIPPLDPTGTRNGAFASRNEASKVLNLLAGANVDLTIYGHVHSYYRFQNAGIDAHISGGGGAIPEKFDGIGRHFLDVTASSNGIGGVEVVRVD